MTEAKFTHPLVNADIVQVFNDRSESWARSVIAREARDVAKSLQAIPTARAESDAVGYMLTASSGLGKIEGALLGLGCFPADIVYRLGVELQSAVVNRSFDELLAQYTVAEFIALVEEFAG